MAITFDDVIERFRSTSLSNRERGDKFEALVQRYLKLDPLYAQRFTHVWRWSEWPERGREPDTGIDLVAEDAVTGYLWAIQCKFYEPTHAITKPDIDSFLATSGRHPFRHRLIVSTTDKWNRNAEAALDDQQIPVQRIGLPELTASPIDWSFAGPPEDLDVALSPTAKHAPRPHQQAAIDDVFAGFAEHDRGKLVMACGTGKTYTALAISERLAQENGGSARVLFLVPSLALLSQTLREWTANASVPISSYAVCSDTQIGRNRRASDFEDIRLHDLAIPATTDGRALVDEFEENPPPDGLTVVFSTYHSIQAVSDAQALGIDPFDLVICDEAHRTTGVTLSGGDESHFVRVHDAAFILAERRLYMTATPRLYAEATKKAADDADALLASMDDETIYGPEFHRLGFGDAVEADLLTDYKVLVLTVSSDLVADVMQHQLADENRELHLDDVAKMIGCWNGLAKRTSGSGGLDFTGDPQPMRRAVAFLQRIKDSQSFADEFSEVIAEVQPPGDVGLECAVRHVDGTMNALERGERLEWLRAPVADGQCRILSNARCLSEGVDVPDLDAVLFLSPRGSEVDVVQAVGRVMRKAPGKKYGYIILPVTIPSGETPEEALRQHNRFKGVWQVLQALRAHDERFDALVNTIDLNPTRAESKIGVAHIDQDGDDSSTNGGPRQLVMNLDVGWRDAVYARIVAKVGRRTYWEDWADSVIEIADAQQARIRALLGGARPDVTAAFEDFVKALRAHLNNSITDDDAIGMLSQHLITKPVFDALFEGYAFAAHNPVSVAMDDMIAALGDAKLGTETDRLEGFYRSVRRRAEGIENAEGKQRIITELYENFFRKAFKKTADALGIVYTPVEIVDFIIRAADDALHTHLGMRLTDERVHVLDPFTGTGTFIVRLLQSGLIRPEDLLRKYTDELHANEILLLAYYIAAVNIEATYHGVAGGDYLPFPGIALTDTFQITEVDDTIDTILMPANNERIERQLGTDITVIVGNPPYSVGQTNANDDNQNLKYPTLDGRIEETYAARSSAQNKNSLYDSYLRALRWATDRIGDRGAVAFVTNGGWIDGNTASGVRLSLADDFSNLYVYNLRGNQRTAGELSRREGGKVFGQGSRASVAIIVAVKDPDHAGTCEIRYRDVGDYLSREQKLDTIGEQALGDVSWQRITPNPEGDWINQRDHRFGTFPVVGDKSGSEPVTVFEVFTRGLETGRDAWVYGFSRDAVARNAQRTIRAYNEGVDALERTGRADKKLSEIVQYDATAFSWDRAARRDAERGKRYAYRPAAITVGTYRPFTRQHVYFDPQLNAVTGQLPKLFPTPSHANVGVILTGAGSHFAFTPFLTDLLPNLHVLDTAQFFPRWRYERAIETDGSESLFEDASSTEAGEIFEGFRRIDNVTDGILAVYREALGTAVTKDAIFFSVYATLHHPAYRTAFAADLSRALPRVPTPTTPELLSALADAGRRLAELHLGYECASPYALTETVADAAPADVFARYAVTKMRFARNDRTTLYLNEYVTLGGIPDAALAYQLGPRSAVEWIVDRYRVRTDKASGIVNDPNDWAREHDDPRYIVDLVKRIVTVSVETMKIVDDLPDLPLDPA